MIPCKYRSAYERIDLAKAHNSGYIKASFHEKPAGFDFT
jgi:hypothetical protein